MRRKIEALMALACVAAIPAIAGPNKEAVASDADMSPLVAGQIQRADGTPAANVAVTLVELVDTQGGLIQAPREIGSAVTGADGEWEIERPPGEVLAVSEREQ